MSNITLSIIIPSLRPEKCVELIETIFQNSALDYELILVVDDLTLFELPRVYPKNCKQIQWIIDTKKIGTTYPINLGLNASLGKYLITLSDDCKVTPDWDINMLNFIEAYKKAWSFHYPLIGSFRTYSKNGELGDIGYFNKAFSLFPFISKEDINKLGGYYLLDYHAHYGDPDLGMRCWKSGGAVITCPNAWIYHSYNPDSLHLTNKEKYFKKDEEIFKEKWSYLGEWKNCQRICPNIIDLSPSTIPNYFLDKSKTK